MATVFLNIEYFNNPADGNPVSGGNVYIGQPDLDPKIEANRISVTLQQEDGTDVVIAPSAQPITLSAGGRFQYLGSPVSVDAAQNYSLLVDDSLNAQVYYNPNANLDLTQSIDRSDVYIQQDNIAAMDADASIALGEYHRTAGYISGGDGGNGDYLIVPAGTGIADNGAYIDLTASGLQAKGLFPNGIINVRQFSAALDGVTDDTVPFQACIDYIETLGGGVVNFNGPALISSALVINSDSVVKGEGVFCKITTNSLTANIFEIGDLVTTTSLNNSFEDFSIWSTVVKTAGAAFKGVKIARCNFENVHISPQEDVGAFGNRLYDGIDFDEFDFVRIYGGTIESTNEGIAVNGNPSNLFGAGLWMGGGLKVTGQVTGAGVHIGGGAGGIYFGDMVSANNFIAVKISVSRQPGAPNREIFFGALCALDATDQECVLIEADSATHVDMTGLWIASAGQVNSLKPGITVQAPNPSLVLTMAGCRVYNNMGGGCIFNDGTIVISGGVYYQNGLGVDVTQANGFGNGIWCPNPAINSISILGARVSNNGNAGNSAGYGVKLSAGVNIYNISNNDVTGNIQGPILEANAPTVTGIIRENIGFVTENAGTVVLLDTNTSITVNHGLTIDPNNVMVTPIASDEGVGHYVDNVGPTSFDIVLNSVATANRTFEWRATRGLR